MCKNPYFCIYQLYTIFVNLINKREGKLIKPERSVIMKDTNKAAIISGIISGIAGIIIGVNTQKSVEKMEKENEAFSEKVDSDMERIRNEMEAMRKEYEDSVQIARELEAESEDE